MLKHHRCTTCTEYVNCRRRKSKKRKFPDFDDERCDHHHAPPPPSPAGDGGCGGACDETTVEKELEILRRNVRFLADRHSSTGAPTARDPLEDPMVCFVISEGEQITAHRSILAGVSPVFESMFSISMLEKETGKVYITDASLSTMEAVVKYCYTADITFSVDMDLDEVTHISQKYEISSLKDRCETEHCNRFHTSMKTTVDLTTALAMTEDVLGKADKYGMERLTTTCLKELHLRNYIVKRNCEMDRPRKSCSRGLHHSRNYYLVPDRTSPRALAKLMRLSFRFGTDAMQDETYRTVQGLIDEEGKQVWMEVMKFSFTPKD
ncbi:unnamed protein product [Calypogeia fissa]